MISVVSFALKILLSSHVLDVQAYMFSTSLLLVGCTVALFLLSIMINKQRDFENC